MNNEQLYKRQNGNYKEVYPNTLLSSILDKESGKALKDIISAYNHLYVPFVNNIYETLTTIPVFIRRKGLWVTWETEDGINTYQFNLSTAEAADDAIWGNIESWEQVPDLDYYENHAAVPDGSITLEKLSDEVRQWLIDAGKIINYPDEEDITEQVGLLKLADRPKVSGVNSMGYKILRRNKSFAEQVTEENTIYEIKYDFTINENVTIPNNCVLKFNGGSISGIHTIIGANTIIIADEKEIFDSVIIAGIWNVHIIYDKWFKIYNNVLRNVFALTNDNIQNTVIIDGIHVFKPIENNEDGVVLKSNTEIILNGTYSITSNPYPFYNLFYAVDKSNIYIHGSGSIIGDADTHDYQSLYPSSPHQWGYGFFAQRCNNVKIEDVTITNMIADGIVMVSSPFSYIINCTISDNRRCGISATSSGLIIKNNYFTGNGVVNGIPTNSSIDVECEYDEFDLKNIYIIENVINGDMSGITIFKNTGNISNVYIKDNNISTIQQCVYARCAADDISFVENLFIENNVLKSTEVGSYIDTIVLIGTKNCNILSNHIDGGFILNRNALIKIYNNDITYESSHAFSIRHTSGNLDNNSIYCNAEDLSISILAGSQGLQENVQNLFFDIRNNKFVGLIRFINFGYPTNIKNNIIIYPSGSSIINDVNKGSIYSFEGNTIEVLDMTGVGFIFNAKTAEKLASYKRNTFKLHNRQGDAQITVNNKIFVEDNRVILIDDVNETESIVEQKFDNTVGAVGSSVIRNNGLRKYSDGTQWVDATGTLV